MKKRLTWEQRRIVAHERGHALVKAVPGSGKTTTLVKRVERLAKSGVDPRRILILMYNKSAQQSFTAKLKVALGAQGFLQNWRNGVEPDDNLLLIRRIRNLRRFLWWAL